MTKTSANNEDGLQALLLSIEEHRRFLEDEGLFLKLRKERIKSETLELINQQLQRIVHQEIERSEEIGNILESVAMKQINPYSAASSILNYLMHNSNITSPQCPPFPQAAAPYEQSEGLKPPDWLCYIYTSTSSDICLKNSTTDAKSVVRAFFHLGIFKPGVGQTAGTSYG